MLFLFSSVQNRSALVFGVAIAAMYPVCMQAVNEPIFAISYPSETLFLVLKIDSVFLFCAPTRVLPKFFKNRSEIQLFYFIFSGFSIIYVNRKVINFIKSNLDSIDRRFLDKMADSEIPASTADGSATEPEPWLGVFDWIILALALIGALYYLLVVRRGKKTSDYNQFAATIKPISPMNGSSYAKSADDRSFVAKMKSSVSKLILD